MGWRSESESDSLGFFGQQVAFIGAKMSDYLHCTLILSKWTSSLHCRARMGGPTSEGIG